MPLPYCQQARASSGCHQSAALHAPCPMADTVQWPKGFTTCPPLWGEQATWLARFCKAGSKKSHILEPLTPLSICLVWNEPAVPRAVRDRQHNGSALLPLLPQESRLKSWCWYREAQPAQGNSARSSSDVLFFLLKGRLAQGDKGCNRGTAEGQETSARAYILSRQRKYTFIHVYKNHTCTGMSGNDSQGVSSKTPWTNNKALLLPACVTAE